MNNNSGKVDFDTELKTTKHSDLKALVFQFKTISSEAKKLCNRKDSPYGIFDFYRLLKKVTKPLELSQKSKVTHSKVMLGSRAKVLSFRTSFMKKKSKHYLILKSSFLTKKVKLLNA